MQPLWFDMNGNSVSAGISRDDPGNEKSPPAMLDLIFIMLSCLFRSFLSQAAVQAEIIALRHHLVVLQRTQMTKRLILRPAKNGARASFTELAGDHRGFCAHILTTGRIARRLIH